MVQTMGVALSTGISAWLRNSFCNPRFLRIRFLRNRSPLTFLERHALQRVSIFHLRISAVGLDRRADQQLNTIAMSSRATISIIFFGLALILGTPPAITQRSWKRLVIGFILTPFAVLLPLAFFVLSAFLTPDAKDVCPNGPLDCFYLGKLALTPFVFWATAALYSVEIIEVRNSARPWVAIGLILGAIVSSVCLIFGVLTLHRSDLMGGDSALICLLVPFYTAIWYNVRAIYAVRTHPVDSTKLTIALTSSLPFWAVSIWWSYKTYLSLPDHVDRCFVVTAASQGHRTFVGPFLEVQQHDGKCIANQQLATLWAFEALWRQHAPGIHAAFRRVYNVVGPIIAKRIASPWMADAVFVALKPAEFFARFVVNAVAFHAVKLEPRHLGS